MKADEFDWPVLLNDINYFYFSGITPAIGSEQQAAVFAACQYCSDHNITVICDMNFREKMWSPEAAQAFFKTVMPFIDVCIANDEDFEATLGIKAFDGNMATGIDQLADFREGMLEVTRRWPNVHTVASVVRNIHSVEESQWTALLVQNDKVYQGPTFDMHIFEGVAAGDAFGAGLVHALFHHFEPLRTINYAISASVLKLTIGGDLNLVTNAEVEASMKTNSRVNR